MTGLEIIKTDDCSVIYEIRLSVDLTDSIEIIEIGELREKDYTAVYVKECPIGTHFVDFLNTTVPVKRILNKLSRYLSSTDFITLYLSKNPNEIPKAISILMGIKSMLMKENFLILISVNQINEVIRGMKYYLTKEAEITDKAEYWSELGLKLRDFINNLMLAQQNRNDFYEATEFCVCDTDIEAYKNLNIPQKIYIYSKFFDNYLFNINFTNSVSLCTKEDFDDSELNCKAVYMPSPEETKDKNDLDVLEFARKISKVDTRLIRTISIDNNYKSFLLSSFFNVIQGNVKINKCRNCGLFFIPSYKVNEVYCDNVLQNGKTCKQVGYENKLNSDEILKSYRTAYKTQNARKLRNSNCIPDAEERFKKWHMEAKNKLADTQDNKMSLDDFKIWLKSDWWLKKGGGE